MRSPWAHQVPAEHWQSKATTRALTSDVVPQLAAVDEGFDYAVIPLTVEIPRCLVGDPKFIATDPYLSDSFLGDVLFRVARSNFAEAGWRIALSITMSLAVLPFP